ncbi:uncharacterized protein [Primulina eburnea]|uniref:uncharacterized protein n=1 Tax=Primulina eburnea TaxID=1245227 RepID=UPI003C6BFEB8
MQPQKKAAQKPTENPVCPKRNRKREGECLWASSKCFECGSTDHIYAKELLTVEAPDSGPSLCEACRGCRPRHYTLDKSIYIVGVATNALLDSGATHSFISDGFVSYLGVKYNKLDEIYSLTIPFGEELPTSSVVRDLSLDLQGHTVFAELIVLQMTEFDIIMGMNWLSKNGVTIDLQQKSVRVRPLSEQKFVFEPSGRNNTPQIISCLQARKLMHKGCQAFFASIISAPVTTSQIVAEVPVVRDFPNVFPKDVVVIPPEQEVEFSVDHMSGTVPISKEPYRSVRTEMKELK